MLEAVLFTSGVFTGLTMAAALWVASHHQRINETNRLLDESYTRGLERGRIEGLKGNKLLEQAGISTSGRFER